MLGIVVAPNDTEWMQMSFGAAIIIIILLIHTSFIGPETDALTISGNCIKFCYYYVKTSLFQFYFSQKTFSQYNY